MTRPGLVIEFNGISASGKSTIARVSTGLSTSGGLVFAHRGSGYEWVGGGVTRAATRCVHLACGISKFWRPGLGAVPWRLWTYGPAARAKAMLSLLGVLGMTYMAKRKLGSCVLLDQGVFQRLGSVALRSDDVDGFFQAICMEDLRLWPLPDGVVLFAINTDSAVERYRVRTGSGTAQDREAVLDLLTLSQRIVAAQVALARELGIPVLELDASEPAARSSDRVRNWAFTLEKDLT